MAKLSTNRAELDEIEIVGAERHPLRDIYYFMLTMRWWVMLLVLAGAFLVINAIFAGMYLCTDGIEGAKPGSFADAFFFSAQTLGTIGYGAMHPTNFATNVVATGESVVSILFIAVATGLVFTRFSRSTESVRFSENPVIQLMDGVPTLTLRIGNDREGAIMDATVGLTMFRTHKTAEGLVMYRMKDLKLARERTSALGRTFTLLHHINEDSPIYGLTPDDWEKDEVEILVNVVGTDDTLLQPVYGRCRYLAHEIRWGHRFEDILTDLPNGRMQLDVRKFDTVIAMEPTESFPYPRKSGKSGRKS
jgi:inward rectifier potassium channel